MKLYQIPNGIVTHIGPFFEGETMKEIGDTKDGWVINTGTMPPKDALVEVCTDGQTAAPHDPPPPTTGITDQSGDIMAYRIIRRTECQLGERSR